MPDHGPVTLPSEAISSVFANTVAQIREVVRTANAPIDMELTFRMVKVDKGGIPVFSPRSSESVMEIRLATRVTPEDVRPR